jgi:hypothetical protein
MKMGQRQKGPNYVLQKMTKIYKLSTKFESPGLKTVREVDYTK